MKVIRPVKALSKPQSEAEEQFQNGYYAGFGRCLAALEALTPEAYASFKDAAAAKPDGPDADVLGMIVACEQERWSDC